MYIPIDCYNFIISIMFLFSVLTILAVPMHYQVIYKEFTLPKKTCLEEGFQLK